jgi:hypothetical protein
MSINSTRRKRRVSASLCIILPACAVVGAHFFHPVHGPASAYGHDHAHGRGHAHEHGMTLGDPSGTSLLAPAHKPEVFAETSRLLAEPLGPSPLADHTPKTKPVVITAEPEPEKAPPPEFTLTSVAGRGDRGFAMIDGTLRRVGEELVEGWTVREIDTAGRTVRVAGPEGIVLVLTLRKD